MNLRLIIVNSIFALTLGLVSHLAAEDSSTDSRYEELKAKVVSASELLALGDLDGFVKGLPGVSPNDSKTADFIKTAKGARLALPESIGASISRVALIREESSGKSFYQFSIEEGYASGMVLWRLVYYRGENAWQLRHIHFNPGEAGLQDSPENTSKLDQAPKELADLVMQDFSRDNVVDGVARLVKSSHPKIAANANGTDVQRIALTVQLDAINGNPSLNDYELIKTETTGPHLVRFQYIIRRKTQGHHVHLTFYKSDQEWKTTGWHYSNDGQPVFVARQGNESQSR